MKRSITSALLIFVLALIGAGVAAGSDVMMKPGNIKLAVQVKGAGTYDYIIVGMNSGASDGFDNAYDTVTPGPGMTNPYILTVIKHPKWKTVKKEFRTDFRAVKRNERWDMTVMTNAAAGTQLMVSIDADRSSIPSSCRVLVKDPDTGITHDLTESAYTFATAASPSDRSLELTVDYRKARHDRQR
jgi:hypothetical protein